MKKKKDLGFQLLNLVMYTVIFALLLYADSIQGWLNVPGKLGLLLIFALVEAYNIRSLVMTVKKPESRK